MAFQAGTAFVPVIPSLRGFQARVAATAAATGRAAGRSFGQSFGPAASQATEGARGFTASLGRVGSAASRTGATLSKSLSLPVAAVGLASIKTAGDFEASMNRVKAVTGATGKDFDALVDQAQRLGKTTQFSASEAADAMGFLAMAGFKVDEIMTALPGVLNLAAAGQLDLAEAADIASNILSGYGLEVAEINRLNDVLAKTFTSANVDMRMLGESFKYVGPVASSAGIQFEEAAAAIGLLGNAGIQGSEAGTALRGAIARLLQPTAEVSDTLKRLGVNVVDSKGELLPLTDIIRQLEKSGAKTADMMTIFGLEAGPAMQALVSQGSGALGQLTKDLENSGGTAQRIADTQMEGLNGSLKELQSAFEGLMLAIADTGLLAGATSLVNKLTELTSAAGNANPELLKYGVIAGGIAAAIGPATWATGKLASGVGTVVGGVQRAVAPIGNFVTGLRNVNAAMAANATMSTRLGAALRSQIMLWRQQAAATGVSTGRIILNAAAQKIAAAATRLWAIAQGIFNAVMRANPLMLIVTAIMLVVGAVILAYKRFDWFRNLVDRVWAGIQSAISTAWGFIKPIFDQIASILVTVVGTALRWYWAYVKFVFTTVWTIIQNAWAIIQPIFNTIASVVRGVLGGAFIFFRNLIKVVWIAIQIYIKVAWTLIKGYFDLIKLYVTKVLAPVFRWLYNNVIKPVWNGIRAAIGIAWGIIKGIFNAIRGHLTKTLGPAFTLLRSVAGKAWNGLKSTIQTVWNSGIKPAFDKVRSAVGKVRDAFRAAVDGIKRIWDRLKGIAKTPVNFVIGLYNNGIVKLVNKIAGFAGIKTRLDKIPRFARGGIMPGYRPGVDSLIAAVSPGESIFRPEFTKAVGKGFVVKANDVARRSGVEGVRKWLSGPDAIGGEGLAFARGGIVPRYAGAFRFGGIIGRFVKGVRDFSIGNVAKSAKGLLDKVLGGLVPGSGVFRDVVAAIPAWIKDNVLKWITKSIDSGVGGPPVQRALRYARAQAGKPYVWGGVGPGGFDCSGFMSALTNVIKGKPPNRRLFTTFSFTGAANGPVGFRRNLRSGFTVGVTNAGVGHMSGTLGGVNVESRGSAGVVVGPRARGASSSLYSMRYGLKYDNGGLLQRGLTLAYHGARQPDRVLTDSQWQAIHAAARGGDGPSTVNNFYPRTLDMTVRDLEVLQRKQDARARIGRPR